MTHKGVAPQAQSLCFASQLRQLQYSHQIHLRCWISRIVSARIQMRMAVLDTRPRSHRAGRPAMGRPAHSSTLSGLACHQYRGRYGASFCTWKCSSVLWIEVVVLV